jgi:hypothetical protein
MANPGLTALGTNTELQITSNTGSTSTTKFSVYDYTAGKVGYVAFPIIFNGGTNGVYKFSLGDGTNFSDNNAMGTAQIFAGIEWTFGASNTISYKVLNGSTWGTTGISNPTTLFVQSTSTVYQIEVYANNTTSSASYYRSGTTYAMATGTWDLWVNGSIVGDDLAKGGLSSDVIFDSYAFNHQNNVTSPGTIYIDDIVYSNALPAPGNPTAATPTFNPAGGNYLTTQNVTISCATENSTIYYTTDGSDPDDNSTPYTGAIEVSSTTTIKAIAYATGYDPSAIATAIYSFPTEVANIAALRASPTGSTWYKLTGEAVLTFKTADRHAKYIQDATGAILIDDPSGIITTSYNLYDGITGIVGTLSLYNSMIEFTPVADPGAATSSSNTVTPASVTIASLTTDYQAKLVTISNASISETGNFAASTNYTLTDNSKATGVLRTAYTDLNYIGTPIPEVPQDITGVVLQYSTAMQLVPRSLDDFAVASVPWPVTFYVDMTYAPSFTTVEVSGDFNSWGGDVMTLVSDNIYSFTTDAIFDPDDVITFKFRIDGGATWEPNPNRTYTVVAGTNNYYAVWNVMLPAEITWANLQSPDAGTIDEGDNFDVYARVYAQGLTGGQGQAPNLNAWIGYSTENTDPATWTTWTTATYNIDYGNNEEYQANLGAVLSPGIYYFASRFKLGFAGYVYGGYSSGGGGIWDGSNYVSGVLTVNALEPPADVTDFTAVANSQSAITLTWTDASGASNYLIKGSGISFADITDPTDGYPEADGGLTKNMAAGVGTYQFTGLNPLTTYYFKIYPYNGSGTAINYLVSGSVPQASATTQEATYSIPDFGFVAASGNWGTLANWKQWDGSGWNNTPSVAPTIGDNVYILSGNTCIVEASGKNCHNLTVETGAKLYANNATMTGPRYVNVYGNIICDGTIGNGSGTDDVISFNIYGTSCSISGNGDITLDRLRKNSSSLTTSLSILMDIQLRFNGDALLNNVTDPFLVTIGSGVAVDLVGNGSTPASGYNSKSSDELIINGGLSFNGKTTILGTCTNNSGNSGLVVESGGSIIESQGIAASVKRYITTDTWHLISSPVAGATSNIFLDDFLQTWDESTATWSYVTSTSEPLTAAKGFGLYRTTGNYTYAFTGNLNAGDKSIGITKSGASATNDGANLVGNPYPSYLDWDGLRSTYGAIYYWDGNAYQTWNGTGAGSQYAAPAQGFFIVKDALVTATEFQVTNTNRTNTSGTFYKSGNQLNSNSLVLETTGNNYTDKLFVEFNDDASEAVDLVHDAYKLISTTDGISQLYSYTGDKKLSIDVRPACEVIQLGYTNTTSGQYQIGISEMADISKAILEDAKTGINHNLLNGAYTFDYTAGEDDKRFKLKMGTVGIAEPDLSVSNIYSWDKTAIIELPVGTHGDVYIYNLAGQQIAARESVTGQVRINLSPNGVYVVKLVTDKDTFTKKIWIR